MIKTRCYCLIHLHIAYDKNSLVLFLPTKLSEFVFLTSSLLFLYVD